MNLAIICSHTMQHKKEKDSKLLYSIYGRVQTEFYFTDLRLFPIEIELPVCIIKFSNITLNNEIANMVESKINFLVKKLIG